MNEDEFQTRLTEVFREVFDDPALTISREMTASDVKEWDSFNHVRLIVSIEETFDVSLPTSEVADLRNVGELMDLIRKHVARR
jgi:acyl carrier protein